MARICMVAFTHYSTDTRIRREAESLVERGDTVDMIGLRENSCERKYALNGVRVFQIATGRYRGSNPIIYLIKYLLFFVGASLLLVYLHLRRPYQVIQVHTLPDFMVFVAILPKILGAKIILDVHDLMPELYQSKFHLPRSHWLIRFLTLIERASIGFADRAIAVHKPHLDALVGHGNPVQKFIVLLNLPDPKTFSGIKCPHSKEHSAFTLIYHGTVARRHGLHTALQAVALARQEIKDIKLRIIGGGDDFPHLIELAQQLNLTESVTFKQGLSPMGELVPIILEADVGIVPILYDEFTRYMLPVKLLEYVALGKPVICSRTETIEAYFDDSMVQFFQPGNVIQLAESILLLGRDKEKRERLRVNAGKFNAEYNWGEQKQIYYQLIDDLSGQKRTDPGRIPGTRSGNVFPPLLPINAQQQNGKENRK